MGDFNCGLRAESTHVGRGLTHAVTAAPDTNRLQQILRDNNLVVPNTWRRAGQRAETFQSYGGSKTQIDFIVMRCAQADSNARNAAPRADLPFIPTDGMFHLPLFAELPLKVNYSYRAPQGRPSLTLAATQASLRQDPALAQAFSERMAQHDSAASTLDDFNEQMLQTWQSLAQKIRTTWLQRGLLRQCVQTISQRINQPCFAGARPLMASLFACWRQQSTCRRRAKDLQTHCRESKQRQVEQLVQESSQHGASLTGLHRILRKIAPKTTRRRMQLRESNRDLPDTKGQLAIIKEHFGQVYAEQARTPPKKMWCICLSAGLSKAPQQSAP